jgi:hypothetical protein
VRGCQFGIDGIEHGRRTLKDVIVPEAENCVALGSKDAVASAIVAALSVLGSVRFNDQTPFKAGKVHDVGIDDDLPLEFETWQAAVAEH